MNVRILAARKLAVLTAVSLLSFAGCGSQNDTPAPTASIGGAAITVSNNPAAPEQAAEAPRSGRRGRRAQLDMISPRVLVRTSMGDFTLKLDGRRAPLTVDNFMTYVDAGHYNQTVFHQVWENFIVLGGGYNASMEEKKVYTSVRNEAHNGLKNVRGTIAMARDPEVIDSSTCQFFLNVADNANLDFKGQLPADYGYCVFGEVVEGMDVVDRISKVEVQNTSVFEKIPVKTVMIESMKRLP